MVTYSLSVPQKIIAGCVVAVFLLTAAILIAISWRSWQSQRPRPVSVTSVSNPAHVQASGDGTADTGFDYDEVITLSQGFLELTSGGRRIVTQGPASFSLGANSVKFTSGLGFVQIESQTSLAGTSSIAATNVSGIFDGAEQQFVILNGTVSLNGNALGANRAISLKQAAPSAGSFDRAKLAAADWSSLRDLVVQRGIAPLSLSDTTPPMLTLTPSAGSRLLTGSTNIEGVFSEEIATLLINGQTAQLQDPTHFSMAVFVRLGVNPLSVIAVDKAGNQLTENVEYLGVTSLDALTP